MNQYTIRVTVRVEQDGDPGVYRHYKVRCNSADDAIQLAFALDHGWGIADRPFQDATGLLELAKSYCVVAEMYPIT